ncbi:conserved protein of unknown function [Candidatus Hydrogenisulfobacillus filiaventi]|uniref:PspA-associated domain-containing protein n=1 Tax=Candidatus Hydrogenisulfobacillus filiaventi TaxID=2707344 RepID=A0A6F8ZK61_9FIRM|nr:hypothetical protein [Bacillota bacterium]CAB1130150.1 conserved protein of unknown function [Candidatus Hydrogenisulfobacillus filiaventi]
MIVRILSEGQYRVDDAQAARLDRYDEDLLTAVERNDEGAFRRLFEAVIDLVRQGERLGDTLPVQSDLILPPADTTLEEARRYLETPATDGSGH